LPLTIRTTLTAALLAGLLAGLAFFVAQLVTTSPLIRQAEVYERAEQVQHAGHDHGAASGVEEWEPADGAERTLFTLGADVLVGMGYAFLLTGAIGLRGRPVSPYSGLVWGAADFAVFVAAPAIGLPPEPPGGHAADLLARQIWWIGTAAATAAGLWLWTMRRRPGLVVLGAALMVAPHLIGAPKPVAPFEYEDLAQSFVLASLACNAVLWVSLGLALGLVLPWLSERDPLGLPRTSPAP
jgi:cobalt transporter subunit CbtA